jgi:hypothetical protein
MTRSERARGWARKLDRAAKEVVEEYVQVIEQIDLEALSAAIDQYNTLLEKGRKSSTTTCPFAAWSSRQGSTPIYPSLSVSAPRGISPNWRTIGKHEDDEEPAEEDR